MIVSKQYIVDYIKSHTPEQNVQFVGRALVVLFNLQTESEKESATTNVDNGVGFTGADGHSGVITAKYYLKHGKLLDWQLERWLKENAKGVPRIAKYWKQLNAEAERKTKLRVGRALANGNYSQQKRKEQKRKNPIGPQTQAEWDQLEREMNDMVREGEREEEYRVMEGKMLRDTFGPGRDRNGNVNYKDARRHIRGRADSRSL